MWRRKKTNGELKKDRKMEEGKGEQVKKSNKLRAEEDGERGIVTGRREKKRDAAEGQLFYAHQPL